MVPAFLDELHVKPDAVTGDWELLVDLNYRTLVLGVPHIVTVPRGFVTDFASIPRLFRWIYESWGAYGLASVVHDYLIFEGSISRRNADFVFREAMQVSKVGLRTRKHLFFGVRAYSILTGQG